MPQYVCLDCYIVISRIVYLISSSIHYSCYDVIGELFEPKTQASVKVVVFPII